MDVVRDIRKALEKKDKQSVKALSETVKSQWETTIKALEFMKEMSLVEEERGNKSYKTERLFSLK